MDDYLNKQAEQEYEFNRWARFYYDENWTKEDPDNET